MKILSLLFIIFFSNSVFAETYICDYEELNKVKKFSLDRVTHSHFKKCVKNECDKKKYSVIFANNDNLIIGDIEEQAENFFLFIINKNTNLFSAANINLPFAEQNKYFSGICVKN